MKTLIYFFSCLLLSLPHLANAQIFGKSPEEKCFDAQMKLWNVTEVRTDYALAYGQKAKGFRHGVYTLDDEGKAQYEAEAWARCMKK